MVTATQIGATTKRLTKAALLAAYFVPLDTENLRRATRLMTGRVFPQWDRRTLQLGGSTVLAALAALSGQDANALKVLWVRLGDLGDLAEQVLPAQGEKVLSLRDVEEALVALSCVRGNASKGAALAELLLGLAPSEAKFVVKLVTAELRIGLKEGAVEDAIARLAQVPVAQVQWANMLLGDVGETALQARQGTLAEVRMRLFHPLKFMLASPTATATSLLEQLGETFVVEDKYDGIRAQAHICSEPQSTPSAPLPGVVHNGVRVALFSRTLDDITASFPDLIAPLAQSVPPGQALLLDGELVPVEGPRILPFAKLQTRLGRKKPSQELVQKVPVAYVAYDLMYAQNTVLLEQPFSVRRRQLEAALREHAGETLRLAPSVLVAKVDGVERIESLFAASRQGGNEGLIIKGAESTYKPGRRGRDWFKLKKALATLDVVVTAAEVGSGRRHRWLSDYTFAVRRSANDPTLLNIGKAYSGLTEVEIAELTAWFEKHTLQTLAHGKVRLVEPAIVLEVTFDRVQKSTRHKSGYALRFPRIQRLRQDKPVEEIDTLATVVQLERELNGTDA